ncbi:MAG: T9SS type A sorting domain-containing protein [Bacteroidia bacterium]|nr:T9SS type A sorting domain-containing protein [Bacteroidia bacterium]
MKRSIVLLLILLTFQGFAQDYKRTFNWYFGDSAGLSFATNPPTVLTNGVLNTWEGCSSISDTNGNLQFYTDGRTVWNKNHQVMQNGTGLKADPSSTQAALIIPVPQNDSLFYIFTTDAVTGGDGLRYSIVNLTADNSNGLVTVKNIMLKTPSCEKLTATYHSNGTDVWVMTHDFGNNIFRAYLITKNGLNDCPVVSNAGSNIDTYVGNAQGMMKFSKTGNKLYNTVYTDYILEIFDFDNVTGKVSPYNFLTLNNILLAYGIEFSPNMRYLYVTDKGKNLYQYDLSLGNEDSINTKRYTISTKPNYNTFNGLQIGLDGKIYVAIYDSLFLSVINNPDSGGTSCGFEFNAFTLGGKKSQAGFPNFISNYFNILSLDFGYSFSCGTKQATFLSKSLIPQSNWQWEIKKLADGSMNSFSTQNISYTFPDSGWYEVKLKAGNDSISKQVYVEGKFLPVTDKYFTCGADSFILIPNNNYRCLIWNDTLSAQSFTVKENGVYRIGGYNLQGCWITDSVKIFFVPQPLQPVISRLKDSIISTSSKNYQWYMSNSAIAGATSQRYKPMQNDWYMVSITDSNGCSNISDSFYVGFVGIPAIKTDEMVLCYPNPASDELTIELSSILNETIEQIELWNITGQQVKRIVQPGASRVAIPCKQLPKGVYFIQLQTNNKHTYHNKIVIQ